MSIWISSENLIHDVLVVGTVDIQVRKVEKTYKRNHGWLLCKLKSWKGNRNLFPSILKEKPGTSESNDFPWTQKLPSAHVDGMGRGKLDEDIIRGVLLKYYPAQLCLFPVDYFMV